MEVKERIIQLRRERVGRCRNSQKRRVFPSTPYINWYNDKNYTPSRDAIEDICGAFQISLAEFYGDIDVDRLTDSEIKLLELFRKVPESKGATVLDVVKTFTE